jgi:hypothetical protein
MSNPAERKLLKFFDRYGKYCRKALVRRFGNDEAAALMTSARGEFETLVPGIPMFDGGRNPMTKFVHMTYLVLAFWKAFEAHGHSREEFGAFVDEAYDPPFFRLPLWIRRTTVTLLLPVLKGKLRKLAAASQERRFSDGFVMEFVEGDGKEVEFGLDVTECACCKACEKHDALEIVPFMCAIDDKMSAGLDLGLRRTGTRALGALRCDFRYKRGGTPLTLKSQYGETLRIKS